MLTMVYDITINGRKLAVLDSVELKESVELLADIATIRLPAAVYNKPLKADELIRRGDKVKIEIGYREVKGASDTFDGFVRTVTTDGGSIEVVCEDGLFLFRKPVANKQYTSIEVKDLLTAVISQLNIPLTLDCSYSWKYGKFTFHDATGYDVLKKIQDECGADIYIKDGTLHVHAPAEKVGETYAFDFAKNIEKSDLTYQRAEDNKLKIVVKATATDGTIKTVEVGSDEGDKREIMCASSDNASMKARGEAELKRLSYDGYSGSITGWLFPAVHSGDAVQLHDDDYAYKDGKYYVNGVTTTFSRGGGVRKIELGIRLT
jgi:hypothetical protein